MFCKNSYGNIFYNDYSLKRTWMLINSGMDFLKIMVWSLQVTIFLFKIDCQGWGLWPIGSLEDMSHITQGRTFEPDHLSEGARCCYLQQTELNNRQKKSVYWNTAQKEWQNGHRWECEQNISVSSRSNNVGLVVRTWIS